MKRNKRTLKAYTDLYRNPGLLSNSEQERAQVILFPNGEREIWIKSDDGTLGIRMTVSNGPAGLGVCMSSFIGTPPLTVGGNLADGACTPAGGEDYRHLEICAYRLDEKSQAFKARYWNNDNR